MRNQKVKVWCCHALCRDTVSLSLLIYFSLTLRIFPVTSLLHSRVNSFSSSPEFPLLYFTICSSSKKVRAESNVTQVSRPGNNWSSSAILFSTSCCECSRYPAIQLSSYPAIRLLHTLVQPRPLQGHEEIALNTFELLCLSDSLQ